MNMRKADPLQAYKAKRNFAVTSEPAEGGAENLDRRAFVIQKHWATRLHYDFRLELDGVMKSWAVPKGPSFDSNDKRMAIHVEDHPISYNRFEGQIPEGQYGAGKVVIWDKGCWIPAGDPHRGYVEGNLKFELQGYKLRGKWALLRMKANRQKKEAWLLIKEKDEFSRAKNEFSVVDEMPDSVTQLDDKKTPIKKNAEGKVASIPKGALQAGLPNSLSPELATLVDQPPTHGDWLYEVKFDGYRIMTRIDGKKIQLMTRNGHDWSNKLPHLIKGLTELKIASAWIDGEIVVADENGIPDFQLLQNAFDAANTKQILYYVFDLPYYNGYDLRNVPLFERRALLRPIISQSNPTSHDAVIRYSDSFNAEPDDLLASACRLGLEGLIGKRKDSVYVSRRSTDWIKLKCTQRQEFVIGGFTDPKGTRQGIGSLLLGVHDDQGNLLYTGNVGTGFSEKTLADLRRKLDALSSKKNPFSSETDINKRQVHWVEPTLLAEVSFGEWTNTGRIRHAVFHGLRNDKEATTIIREQASTKITSSGPLTLPSNLPKNFSISHADRVIDKSSGSTKIDLIRYYALAAPLMMPHLKERPVSLVRAPDGIGGQLFFQKHMETSMNGIALLDPALDPEHAPLMEVIKPMGLLCAAQMNVIEFHTWNGVKAAIDKPDRMVFDIDPGEGVAWEVIQESTLLLGTFLNQLGLQSFVKTSGGKGLHIIVPLRRRYDWNNVKHFSHAIVQHMAATLPTRFVGKSGPKNRIGKIFIDYLRNGFGATTVAAWSVRARPGLGVSVPIGWEEVDKLRSSGQWTITNIHTRLDQGNAPWRTYAQSAQNITAAMKLLGFAPGKRNS